MIYAYYLYVCFVRSCTYGFEKIKFRSANGFMLGSGESDKESGGVKWIGGVGCDRMGTWRVEGSGGSVVENIF